MPVGLGSHVSWDRKLDGRLAAAIMSIPAVKGVEIGLGFESARRKGSEVHDEIDPDAGNVARGTRAPAHQSRRRPGRRHHHRRAAGAPRRDEADQHADAPARRPSTMQTGEPAQARGGTKRCHRRCRRWESSPKR